MTSVKYDFGMIGLGTMGCNLAYNICDHGYAVAGFDKDSKKSEAYTRGGTPGSVYSAIDMPDFINSLKAPRTVILLVPAGEITDLVIDELIPLLSENDLILDFGNSHYTDTNRRIEKLRECNLHFMGVGVSGGENGARNGPSIMPGGDRRMYERIAPMLKSIAAKTDERACVDYMGTGSAGHYVKMVHNGIEYGLMQLIAETYHLLKNCGYSNEELHSVFDKWNKGKLQSFLIEITADIFLQKDELSFGDLVDNILDSAGQKGTGAWTSMDAMDLQIPVTIIDTAVAMRDLSSLKTERIEASKKIHRTEKSYHPDKKIITGQLENAFEFAMLVAYSQGFALLQKASEKYKYELRPQEISAVWKGGCIIRAKLLDDIHEAFSHSPGIKNLLLNEKIASKILTLENDLQQAIIAGMQTGTPMPAYMSALSWFHAYRSEKLPANLIQAQRDYFGAHTYKRTDREGTFHTHWKQSEE